MLSMITSPKRIISIEGNIGSGKSTLIEKLQESQRDNFYKQYTPDAPSGHFVSDLLTLICRLVKQVIFYIHFLYFTKPYLFVEEPVNEWLSIKDDKNEHILSKFYKDKVKYAFPFQMMAYISRLNKLRNALKVSDTVFTERSLSTDKHVFATMLHESDDMNTFEYQIYNKWFDAFNKETAITHVVYVKTDPATCFERIEQRAREGENNITKDYLSNCHTYHESMIQHHIDNNVSVLTLDGNQNVFDDIVFQDWCKQIEMFI